MNQLRRCYMNCTPNDAGIHYEGIRTDWLRYVGNLPVPFSVRYKLPRSKFTITRPMWANPECQYDYGPVDDGSGEGSILFQLTMPLEEPIAGTSSTECAVLNRSRLSDALGRTRMVQKFTLR